MAHHTVQSLTSELRTTKMALEEMSKRERQVKKQIMLTVYFYTQHNISL